MDMFVILIVLMFSQVYTYVKFVRLCTLNTCGLLYILISWGDLEILLSQSLLSNSYFSIETKCQHMMYVRLIDIILSLDQVLIAFL